MSGTDEAVAPATSISQGLPASPSASASPLRDRVVVVPAELLDQTLAYLQLRPAGETYALIRGFEGLPIVLESSLTIDDAE